VLAIDIVDAIYFIATATTILCPCRPIMLKIAITLCYCLSIINIMIISSKHNTSSKSSKQLLQLLRLLSLLLPTSTGDVANNWFKSVTICEVNQKCECSHCFALNKDVHFVVGDIKIFDGTPPNGTDDGNHRNHALVQSMDAPGTLYLDNRLCTYITIPNEAKLTSRKVMSQDFDLIFSPEMIDEIRENKEGLPLTIQVTSVHILKPEQACLYCISFGNT
jgi:hypothetical protein